MGLTEMLAAAKEREANAGSLSAAAAAPAPAASVVAEAEAQAREVREGAADAERLKRLLGGSGGKSAGMALNAFAGGRASMAGLASKTRQVSYEPPAQKTAAAAAPPKRRKWSPEFLDFWLYALFVAILAATNIAGTNATPYYFRRNLEDQFLVNEFEPNCAYDGIACFAQIEVWLRDVVAGYAYGAGGRTWHGKPAKPRLLADGVTMRVGLVRVRVVRARGGACPTMAKELTLPDGTKLDPDNCYPALDATWRVKRNYEAPALDLTVAEVATEAPTFATDAPTPAVVTPEPTRAPSASCRAAATKTGAKRRGEFVNSGCPGKYLGKYLGNLACSDGDSDAELPYTSATTGITYYGDGNAFDLSPDRAVALRELSALHAANFFAGRSVRAVIVSFCVYNPHADIFGLVRANVEVLPGGGIVPTYQVVASPILTLDRELRGDGLAGEPWGAQRRGAYGELLFYVVCVLYALREVRQFAKHREVYFDSFWNWLEVINLSTYLLVALLRITVRLWTADRTLDDVDLNCGFAADLAKIAHVAVRVDALNAVNMIFSFLKVFKYFRHVPSLAQFTNTCARSVSDCLVLLGIMFVGILGFAIAFFVGYGASTDAYKDFHSSFITLLDVLMGASDIGGLVASDHVLVAFLFFPFVFMNSFIVLSMFLAVIGIAFDEVRDEHLEDMKERKDEGIKEADSPFLQDMHYCYDVLVHKILRIPRVDAKVGVGDDDDEEDDDDAALRARCRRLHAEFAAKVEHLRDHQDLLLEAVRARSETESRRLSQGGD